MFQNQGAGKPLLNQFKQIFSYLMAGIYLVLGLYLLIKGWNTLSKLQTIDLGSLLIVYALFRFYRIVRESRMKFSDQEVPDKK